MVLLSVVYLDADSGAVGGELMRTQLLICLKRAPWLVVPMAFIVSESLHELLADVAPISCMWGTPASMERYAE